MTDEHRVLVYYHNAYISVICKTCGWSKVIYKYDSERYAQVISEKIAEYHRIKPNINSSIEYL